MANKFILRIRNRRGIRTKFLPLPDKSDPEGRGRRRSRETSKSTEQIEENLQAEGEWGRGSRRRGKPVREKKKAVLWILVDNHLGVYREKQWSEISVEGLPKKHGHWVCLRKNQNRVRGSGKPGVIGNGFLGVLNAGRSV